jgi:hypothetical protein
VKPLKTSADIEAKKPFQQEERHEKKNMDRRHRLSGFDLFAPTHWTFARTTGHAGLLHPIGWRGHPAGSQYI